MAGQPTDLEDYIQAQYAETSEFIDEHPFEPADSPEDEDAPR